MRQYRQDYNVDLDASDNEEPLQYNRTVRQPTFRELNGYPSGKRPPGKHLRYPAAKYNNLDSDDHISLSSEDEDEPQPVTVQYRRIPHFKFRFINCCYQGNIKKRVNLSTLKSQWKGSILKDTDPVMLIYKNGHNTLLMFATGKFRFMGPFHPTTINAKKQLAKLPHVPNIIKNAPLKIQTCTVAFKLPGRGVHLPRLAEALRRDRYEITFNKREFPAISM